MLCPQGAGEVSDVAITEVDGRVYGVLTVYVSKAPHIVGLLGDVDGLPYSARSWTGGGWVIVSSGDDEETERVKR
jgi:hypothetical protein